MAQQRGVEGGGPVGDAVPVLDLPVQRALAVQRDTPAKTTTPSDPAAAARATAENAERAGDPDVAVVERLNAARKLVDSAWLEPIAWDAYKSSGVRARELASGIWLDQLGLADIDPSLLKKAERAADTALTQRLEQRIGAVIAAKMAAMTRDLGTPAGKQRVSDAVGRLWSEQPGWGSGELADRIYHEDIGPGRIADLGGSARDAATDFWTKLQAAIEAPLTTKREESLSTAAVAGLDAREVEAVRADLAPAATWIATPADTDALTDRVAAALGKPTAHTDPAWSQLRGRMAELVPVAEVRIINDTIPQEKPVAPERWAHLRDRWLNTITKPIWRYWLDNIVNSTVFGNQVTRSTPGEGLHREVAAAMKRVEQSAMRLAGVSSVSELHTAEGAKGEHTVPMGKGKTRAQPITEAGTEFRFEPVSHFDWMIQSQHLSFHGTGRAIDFRSSTNPSVKGAAHQLISILGEGELSEQTIDRGKLGRWADRLAALDARREEIAAQLAAEQDPATQDALRADLKKFEDALKEQPEKHRTATELRDRAAVVYQNIRDTETTFQAAWSDLKDQAADDAALVTSLQTAVAEARQKATDEIADLKARTPADSQLLRLAQAKLTRIVTLESSLSGDVSKGVSKKQKALVKEVGDVAASGLNDLPDWLVEAFTEQGWSWGGTWTGYSDAMHFDYMGSVADVKAQ